jgi:hypothetical protein
MWKETKSLWGLCCAIQDHVKRQTRFTSNKPARDIISRMEATAQSMGFRVETRKYKVSNNKDSHIIASSV